MTENSNSNDDNGAGQIAMTDDLFGWPGDGVHWTWQRCGRYEYRKVRVYSPTPTTWFPARRRRRMSRPCRSPTGTRLGVGMTELDLVRLRELAAELGYWPASTDEEHARLRAQDARYNEQEAQDPGGTNCCRRPPLWRLAQSSNGR
jgi:hypothetical protein